MGTRSVFGALTVLAVIIGACAGDAPPDVVDPGDDTTPMRSAQQLTVQLMADNQLYQISTDEKAEVLQRLVATATARRDALASLAARNAPLAWRLILPVTELGAFPPEVKPLLETPVENVTGSFSRVCGEIDRDGEDRCEDSIVTDSERLKIGFVQDVPDVMTGTKVALSGIRVGDSVLVATQQGSETSFAVLAATIPGTIGEQKTVVMLINFTTDTSQPYTIDQARDAVFGQVSNYWREASYGQTWITGDVYGWYTLNVAASADIFTIGTAADAAATAAGVNLSAYTRKVYVFPTRGGGVGTVGGNPSQAWVWGISRTLIAHEMGHNLGLWHSHSLGCGGDTFALSCGNDAWPVSEYGDPFDTMGAAANGGHYNAYQKERIGWLGTASSPPITTVSASGTYAIDPMETSGTSSKALKILRGRDSVSGKAAWYYFEYRQPFGFDSWLASAGLPLDGIVGHLASTGNSFWDGQDIYVLGLAPDGARLPVGSTFADPSAPIQVKTTAATSTAASVEVTIGSAACVHGNPRIGSVPASWSITPGGKGYTRVVIMNTDSPACSPSSFNITFAPPPGWTMTWGMTGPVSLPPGGITYLTDYAITATAPTALASGDYDLPITATNASLPSYTATHVFKARYAAPCTPNTPLVTVSPAQVVVSAAGMQASYAVTVTNQDTGSCSASYFNFSATVPAGWTRSFSATSSGNLGPGASATTTLSVTSSSTAAAGTYALTIGAADSQRSASGAASYIISSTPPPCTAGHPTVALSPATTHWAQPGATATYSATITNTDSASCTGSTFDLATTVPTGWTSSSTQAIALAPGASGQVTVMATSTADTQPGTYTIGLAISDSANASHTAAASASYTVDTPPCVHAAPFIGIAPAEAHTDTPGASVVYTINVANTDSTTCAASTFDMTDALPAGFSGMFSATSVSLAAGAGGSVTLTVASASTAAIGSYNVGVTATNRGAPSFNASSSASYIIDPMACTRATPRVTIAPSTQWAQSGGTAMYTVTVANPDSVGCPVAIMNLSATSPGSGWTAVFSPPMLDLAPGATGTASLSVTSPTTATGGFYDVAAAATNAASKLAGGATAAYAIGTGGSGLDVTVTTDLPSYKVNSTVTITTTVMSSGAPAVGAKFTVVIRKPDNSVSKVTKTVDADGTVSFHFKSGKPGTFQLTAQATLGTRAGTATATFTQYK